MATSFKSAAAILAIAWSLGASVVVAVRFRGLWAPYKELHATLAAYGVPDWVRNTDSLLIFVAAAFLGAWIVARWAGSTTCARLGLRDAGRGWGWKMPVSLAPMIVGGLALGWMRWTPEVALASRASEIYVVGVRAPIAEELLFRGLLVSVCAAAVGWRGARFWINAIAAALFFASVHVAWTAHGLTKGWPTLLVTGLGGLWYAWLVSRWGSLWVPMVLHAGMNLGWWLASAQGGAGGGGWIENLLRVTTIAAATWWTLRSTGTPTRAAPCA